ncbi:MAG: YqcI/YcgG family protein [Sphingomonas sp.]|uniref:guanitoxin biosynthesis heme-dependent pre-guanitoxin N-hydroxylase GntA n=1 Tax=Sphingomonas sp. TaxID=28214 RepID=UPI0017B58197|nr:guanitoxin biosynthesis heme-dependent pre-guanitoxin N-hydroxylase GntA [Sphingomonas sp.]MBA3667631.1 YqcI/YcgG family protein [Sphingomonas sp.]
MLTVSNDISHPLTQRFRAFVDHAGFPCVGAKAALNRGGMRFVVARDFRSAWDDLRILPALHDLARAYRADPILFQSLVVLFEHGAPRDEAGFERKLWARLQSLSDKDEWLGQPADPRVAHDPDDPHFAMSFGGEAFFVVGLHPNSSRPARRFDCPAMVFNLHDQFERLRAEGRYDRLRSTILDRDQTLAGSVNPMLARHGELSSARQYSGRAVGEEWRCPFSGRSDAA